MTGDRLFQDLCTARHINEMPAGKWNKSGVTNTVADIQMEKNVSLHFYE